MTSLVLADEIKVNDSLMLADELMNDSLMLIDELINDSLMLTNK